MIVNGINLEDVKAVQHLFYVDEKPQRTARQRKFGPGGSFITPTIVVATNSRIIIFNRYSLGLRSDFEIIPYNQITSVRLEKGFFSSTILMRVMGSETETNDSEDKQEGEVTGLLHADAQNMADYISKKIAKKEE